jgi:hypothetical protein
LHHNLLVLLSLFLMTCACCHAAAYPPLPPVERYRLTDHQLFEKLDPAYPGMKTILDTLDRQGMPEAKAALARHFRERTKPTWWIDPHERPSNGKGTGAQERAAAVKKAQDALKHVYRGFSFGEDIDWLDNPTYAPGREFDKEWSMAFLRMPWWGDLGQAYWATGDEKYAREFVRQYRDFTRGHPIPVKRAANSTHPLKYTVPEWRTLEIAIRLSGSWTNAYHHFLTSPSLDDDTLCEMLKSFWEMANHLKQFSSVAEFSSNWLIFETTALYGAGLLFPEFRDAGGWHALAQTRITAELEKQVYPDGVQWELAPSYGAGVLKDFRRVYELGRMNGRPLPESYQKRLEGMYNYYLYSSVNGRMAAFSDSGRADARALLENGARDFPERQDFLWFATGGKEGKAPTETNIAFPYAGHYVMRSGWDPEDRFLILDGGPHGTNHQHEDALNFEMFAYGEHLITDPGIYRYNYDSPWRKFMVSSLAHNTLAVDAEGQCRRQKRATWVAKGPMPNVWLSGKDLTYFRGSYTDGYGDGGRIPVEHTRSVFFIEGRFWVIVDRARPRDTGEHLYESLFMLNAPDAVAEGGRIITRRDGPNLLMAAAPAPGQTAQVVQGQMEPVRRGWKPGGETVAPNPTAVFAQRKTGPATFALALYPVPGGASAPNLRIEFVPVQKGTDPVAVRLTLPDGSRRLLVDQTEEGEILLEGRSIRAPAVLRL